MLRPSIRHTAVCYYPALATCSTQKWLFSPKRTPAVRYVLPKLYAAGWNDEQISEQKSFTDGRIVVAGNKVKRRPQKRLDYLLRYRRDFPIAVVEAKTIYARPGDGLQQAKEYAQILGLEFAYATNGHGIVEHDFLTGQDNDLEAFPSADDLWSRLSTSEGIVDEKTEKGFLLLTTICRGSRLAIIRRSRSIARYRPFCRASRVARVDEIKEELVKLGRGMK